MAFKLRVTTGNLESFREGKQILIHHDIMTFKKSEIMSDVTSVVNRVALA